MASSGPQRYHNEKRNSTSSVLDSAYPVITRDEATRLHVALPSISHESAAAAIGISHTADQQPDEPSTQVTSDTPTEAASEPYYWADGGIPTPVNLVTHNLHWLGVQLVGGVEYVGEMLADFFGLFNARYEWAAEAERQRVAAFEEEELRVAQQERWNMINTMNASNQPSAGANAPSVAP